MNGGEGKEKGGWGERGGPPTPTARITRWGSCLSQHRTHVGFKSASWATRSRQKGGLDGQRFWLVTWEREGPDRFTDHSAASSGALLTCTPTSEQFERRQEGNNQSALVTCLPCGSFPVFDFHFGTHPSPTLNLHPRLWAVHPAESTPGYTSCLVEMVVLHMRWEGPIRENFVGVMGKEALFFSGLKWRGDETQ